MNLKNFILGTVAALVVFFVLGAVFYGMLFPEIWPVAEGKTYDMIQGVFGSLFSAAALSFIYDKFAGAASSMKTSGMTGGIFGALSALGMHFYMTASGNERSLTTGLTEVGINFIMYAVAGIAIWFVKSKFGEKEA